MKFYRKEGQHILTDRSLLKRIVRYGNIGKNDDVLEIGCGTGNLTEFLLENAGTVYGIEKDGRFIKFLEERFKEELKNGRLILISRDAVKAEWPEFTKFVSNIPYMISTEITLRLMNSKYEVAVVMYQREFAERLVAEPGTKKYGRLSVMARAFCRAEIMEYVKPQAFFPRPKVDSAVVRIIPVPRIEVRNFENFERLVRVAFSMRRKKFGKIAKILELDIPEKLENERPENIPPEVYAELSERL